MKKLISLPFILLILNFNAQNDGDIYNIKSFVSDNIELIKNTNPKKVKDRLKFNYLLRNHILRNSGLIDSYLFQFRLNKELKLKMSNNQNYIKIKNRTIFSSVVLLSGFISSVLIITNSNDALFAVLTTFFIIIPSSAVLSLIPQIGTGKIRAQLLKDYFLLVNKTL
tara:strand:+ start:239 stop:739 length:501 start_codon:yes stop_codon:yes gene_type:complete